jgi:PPP family 3-phenylpropionic acid transporter
MLFAALNMTKIAGPYWWGWLADKSGKRVPIIRAGTFFSMLGFAGVFYSTGFSWLLGVVILYSFFWNACLPQFEALTLDELQSDVTLYSRIRLWGSVGFILAVMLVGYVIEWKGRDAVPAVAFSGFILLWLSSFLVRERKIAPTLQSGLTILQILARKEVVAFLAVYFLLQATHGPYYAFYTIYLESYGYSGRQISWLWSLGVVAEIGLFFVIHRWLKPAHLNSFLVGALLFTAMRWFCVAWFPEYVWVQFCAQLLHAASFGLSHSLAMVFVHQFFPGRLHGRGQAVYTSVCYGVGVALGNGVSGKYWHELGGSAIFMVAGGVALVAIPLVWLMRSSHRELV